MPLLVPCESSLRDTLRPILSAGLGHRVLAWTRVRLGSVRHELNVAATAYDVFDASVDRHQLKSGDLQTLVLASLLHDVGRSVDDADHPRIGAKMIRDDAALPLEEDDRQMLSYLTRRHRGRVRPRGDKWLAKLDPHRALSMLAILRLADGLDDRDGSVQVQGVKRLGSSLEINLAARSDRGRQPNLFKRAAKSELFEELTGLRVQIVSHRQSDSTLKRESMDEADAIAA